MAERGGDAAGYLAWFFLGAIACAAAAVLMTPKTGREARDYITEHGNDFLKRAQQKAGETQVMAGDLFDRGREYFETQRERLLSAFDAGKSAMREEMSRAGTEL